MWRVAGGLEWEAIAAKSKEWANPHELSPGQAFVEQLDRLPEGESGPAL